jgi:hypothetical protein
MPQWQRVERQEAKLWKNMARKLKFGAIVRNQKAIRQQRYLRKVARGRARLTPTQMREYEMLMIAGRGHSFAYQVARKLKT